MYVYLSFLGQKDFYLSGLGGAGKGPATEETKSNEKTKKYEYTNTLSCSQVIFWKWLGEK